MSAEHDGPLVYLVLGASGSGRRQVLSDLIADGLGEADRPAVLLASGEAPDPADASLPGLARWTPGPEGSVEAEFPSGASHVFIVVDGRLDPVDQIEALKGWLGDRGRRVDIVLTVVHCQLAEQNPRLFPWFEACIHFSDLVLLNRRDGVSNRWIAEFREKFQKRFFPCLFEFVKDGRVGNPALVLAPVVRRMSHVFDEDEWVAVDEDDDEDELEDGEETEMKQQVDPYLERRSSGGRFLQLPDIAAYLPPKA